MSVHHHRQSLPVKGNELAVLAALNGLDHAF
jgi:hypothetical protein